MAGEMKDYLSAVAADYTTTELTVDPHEVLFEGGAFRQKSFEMDDVSVRVTTRSVTPVFFARLKYNYLVVADSNTIFDMYFDTAKAKGRARTFYWPHITDGNTYTVRFWCDLERGIYVPNRIKIQEITLKIEGIKT
jgi:hypothetical protein